ncbi:zinc ribbon domain-containing protein, partial [Enterocloster bolteae]
MNPSESGEAYILSGKVVCGECGRAFIRKKEQRRKGVSIKWRCPGHRSEACQCYTNEIWEEDIKNTFVNA